MTDENNVNKEEQTFQVEQKEGIKLTRGQKGGYGWEIKILSLDVDLLTKIDNDLKLKFGNKKE